MENKRESFLKSIFSDTRFILERMFYPSLSSMNLITHLFFALSFRNIISFVKGEVDENHTIYSQNNPFKKDRVGCRPGGDERLFQLHNEHLESITGNSTTLCLDNVAGGFSCSNVDLEAFLSLDDLNMSSGANDIWGWIDPETNVEYAMIGLMEGVAFVDISIPTDPILVGIMQTKTFDSFWRDIKTYNNYAFVVSEAEAHGLQIFDLTHLRNITTPEMNLSETYHFDKFGNAHNIFINEDSGYAYVVGSNRCSGGLFMIDVSNPKDVQFCGCFFADGYTHDVQCVNYDGPDEKYSGKEVCFASNEDTVTIVDVTDKKLPLKISKFCYEEARYTHQGWLTDDKRYFLLDDELDFGNTKTFVVDVSNLRNPKMSSVYRSDLRVADHNQYVLDGYAFQANYEAGLRILELTNIESGTLTEVAYFDIFPGRDGFGFNGAWGVFPYLPSKLVLVSGMGQGLFVLRPNLASDNSTIHVADLTAVFEDSVEESSLGINLQHMKVDILVHDENDVPVGGVVVDGSFNLINKQSCTTNNKGSCSIIARVTSGGLIYVAFDVIGISKSDYRYDASANVLKDYKNRSSIKLIKPNQTTFASNTKGYLQTKPKGEGMH